MTRLAMEVQSMLMSGEPFEKVFSELLNTYQSYRLEELFNHFRANYIDDYATLIDENFTNKALEAFASGFANNIKVLCDMISDTHIDEAPHDNHSRYSEECTTCRLEAIDCQKEQNYLNSYYGVTR